MKKLKSERGVSVVNFGLILFIILGIVVIIFILTQNNQVKNENIFENEITNTQNHGVNKKNVNYNTSETDLNVINNNQNQEDDTYKRYFFSQLDETGQSMYNTMINNLDALKSGKESIKFSVNNESAETSFQSAWDAISLDRPEIFYIDTNKLSLLTKTTTNIFGSTKYEYMLEPKDGGTYFLDTWQTKEDVANAIDLVEQKVNKVIYSMTGNRYEKIKYIHDYIINNVEYDQNNSSNNFDMYGALINGKAVCEGYAESFKYFMDKLNIPCVMIYGDAVNDRGETEYHSWNEVLMEDGKWYAIDCTWDDPILIGNGILPESSKYKYFLKGSSLFSSNHKEQSDVSGTGQNFKYPELSVEDYQ